MPSHFHVATSSCLALPVLVSLQFHKLLNLVCQCCVFSAYCFLWYFTHTHTHPTSPAKDLDISSCKDGNYVCIMWCQSDGLISQMFNSMLQPWLHVSSKCYNFIHLVLVLFAHLCVCHVVCVKQPGTQCLYRSTYWSYVNSNPHTDHAELCVCVCIKHPPPPQSVSLVMGFLCT